MTAEWTDWLTQVQQDRAGRLEAVNRQLSAFVRAYDRWVLAQDGYTDDLEWSEINGDLDRQYELLDSLGEDRP